MSTLVALTGFEFGTDKGLGFGPFDGVTGTTGTDVQVIAGAAYEGSYGLRVALTAKGPFWTTATLGTSKTSLVVSLRFRLSTLPSGDTDIISMDAASTTDRAGFFYQSSTGKIVAWIGASTQASAAAISVNTWYTLEWHLDVSANPNVMSWKLDGTAGTQVSLGVAATTVSRLQLGNRGAGTGVADYDAVVVSVTGADYPLGVHSIKILTVDPAGTVTSNSSTNFRAFTNNGTIDGSFNATNIRDAIDELPPTIGASADGAVQISNNATGYIEIPMTTYTLGGGETIAGARMVACGWAADTTASIIEFRSYNGTTETVLYAAADPGFDASTTAPTWVCRMHTLADIDTQSELNALAYRMGFSTDAAPDVGIHAIYTEVAILSSGGATATPAAIAAVTALPAATVSAGSTPTPAAVASVVALPAATVGTGSTVAPAAVVGVVAFPAATIATGATRTPAAVAAVTTLPAATVSGGGTSTPATIAAATALPAAVVAASSTVTPGAVAAVTALPAATVATGSTVTPVAIAATVALPAPAVSAGGNATVSPTPVAASVTVPAVEISAGAGVAPAAIAAVAGFPAPTISVSATVTPAAITVTVAMPTPQVPTTSGATVTPTTVAATVAFPVPAVSVGGSAPTPDLVHVRDRPLVSVLHAGPDLTHVRDRVLAHVGTG